MQRGSGAALSGYMVGVAGIELAQGRVSAASPVLPLNPWVNYYGFPWDVALFGAFFGASLWKFGMKGFYLCIFTYCLWELVDITYSNPFTVVFFGAFLLSAVFIAQNQFFRTSWKAVAILLGYRIATAAYTLQMGYFGPGMACGLVLCSGTDPSLFAASQVIYTLVVFAAVNEGLSDPLIPKVGAYVAALSRRAGRAGVHTQS